MRTFWMYLWLLTKRLYKKPAFLGILLLIPALVLCFGMAAGQESGVVTVALYATDERVAPLLNSELLRYIPCQSAGEAEDLVRYGKADAAWCFPADWEARLEAFCKEPQQAEPVVQVAQREDTPILRLAREKLSGALTVLAAPILYGDFAREQGLTGLSQQELLDYYEAAAPESGLFRFADAQTATTVTYLTAPVRGLLATVTVLAGLAMSMYFTADLQKGVFSAVPHTRLPWLEAGVQLICLVNISAVTLPALALSGMAALTWLEFAAAGLYCLCCAGFSLLLRSLFPRQLGAMLTALTVAMVSICPVFFDIARLRPLQLLLPPTYYLQSLHAPIWLGAMALYTLACLLLTALLRLLKTGCLKTISANQIPV